MGQFVQGSLGADTALCRLSMVVPCFNSEEGIQELYRRSTVACREQFGDSYEIILVDDGSRDKTWECIAALSDKDKHIVGIKLSRNHGHQVALSAGLSAVRGDLVLIIDDDLQDPPELLGPMRRLMEETFADVVYGQRRRRAGESMFKTYTASLFYRLLAKTTDLNIPLDTGDFRLMSRRVSSILSRMPERDRFIRGMVAWLGFKQVPYLYDREARFAGETQYTFGKLVNFAVDALISFSILPLRISTFAGILLAVVLSLVGVYAALSWLIIGTPPGWASITLLMVGTSTVQLLALGIIGEYVGRIYFQTKQRPLFLIAEFRQAPAESSAPEEAPASAEVLARGSR